MSPPSGVERDTEENLGVAQRLRTRLSSLAVAVGLLVGLGLPLTYYGLELNGLSRDATVVAREVALGLTSRPFAAVVDDALSGVPVAAIRVLDAGERPVVERLVERARWWEVYRPAARMPVPETGTAPRAVEVVLSQARVVRITLGVLVVSLTVGALLASATYLLPVRAAERMDRRIEAMIREQESLVEASRALASTLDLRELLDRLTEIAGRLPGIDVVRIWLVEEHTGDLVLHSEAGTRSARIPQLQRFRRGEGVIAPVIETGMTVVRPNVLEDPRLVNTAWFRLEGLLSLLGVPLRSGDTMVGALACMSRTARDWTPAEIALAQSLGSLAAVALTNARVFGESEARRRAAEALADVGRALSQSLDPEAVSQRIADAMTTLLAAKTSVVYRLDPGSEDLVALAVAGTAEPLVPAGGVLSRGAGLSALAMRHRRPVSTANILDDARVTLSPALRRRIEDGDYASGLTVPLVGKDRVIGVLCVGDRFGRIYTADELRLAEAFASQAALALENARLFVDITARRRDAEELARFTRVLTETLDVNAIGDRIVESVLPLFSARSSALCLRQADRSLRVIAWGGAAARSFARGQILPPDTGVAGRAARLGCPAQSRDVLADPDLMLERTSPDIAAVARASGNRAVLAVPLHAKSQLIGVLIVTDQAPRVFSEAEIALLQTFADQAALALENARLYEGAQRAYDDLAAAQAQLVRGETLRAMGELASGVAHHLNNLLAVVLGRLQLARSKTPPPPLDRHLELAERAALDSAEVVRRMRGFSRGQPSADVESLDLNAVAREVIELTRPRWQDEAHVRGIAIEVCLVPGELPDIVGEVAALREVLMNLIMNAIDALPEGGAIVVRTSRTDDAVQCEVEDTGIGMSPEAQRRALEPFFTTKGFQSTGLGLSVTYGIVRRHRGDLVIDSAPGQGTRVRISLPVGGAARGRGPAPAPAADVPLRILVVDDEREVREVVTEILAEQGHQVVQAAGGAEGLAYLDAGGEIDLVLTDLGMPGMTGWEVARAAKIRRPALRVGLLTGWGEQPVAKPEDRAAADFVIAKPVTVDGLRVALAGVRRGG